MSDAAPSLPVQFIICVGLTLRPHDRGLTSTDLASARVTGGYKTSPRIETMRGPRNAAKVQGAATPHWDVVSGISLVSLHMFRMFGSGNHHDPCEPGMTRFP